MYSELYVSASGYYTESLTYNNVDFFKFMLKDYFDYEICKFLEYGFPMGFPKIVESLTLLQEFKDPKEMLKVKNHHGAVEFLLNIHLLI
jgi:hypothetical protein